MPNQRPLLELDDALQRLAAGAAPHRITAVDEVSTFDALGRVLARDVASLIDVPPADNSAMDGYALRVADVPAAGSVLPVLQRIPAGHVGGALAAGSAARIFTGAQIPPGADAIVMQELCAPVDAGVRVDTLPRAGANIRRRGEDVVRGSVVLTAGTRLAPPALGLAASVGAATLGVVARPRIAIFSTGDELVMPGQPLPPGAIYNSNRYMLRALAEAAGCSVVDLGIVGDTLDATRAALRDAAAQADLVVTCGGVSVGEEDHLKPAVEAEGTLEHWQLAIKPGKPLAFGTVRRADATSALFVGLPGNPVSAAVTWLLCATSVLRVLQGRAPALPHAWPLTAGFDWPKADRRREFLRVRIGSDGRLALYANQGSGVLTSMVWADGLVDNPPGRTIAAGDTVRFLPLSALIGG